MWHLRLPHDVTLPLLDPLGEATVARTPAGPLLHGATQLLAWAKTKWGDVEASAAVADYGRDDRLRFLSHWRSASDWGHG